MLDVMNISSTIDACFFGNTSVYVLNIVAACAACGVIAGMIRQRITETSRTPRGGTWKPDVSVYHSLLSRSELVAETDAWIVDEALLGPLAIRLL